MSHRTLPIAVAVLAAATLHTGAARAAASLDLSRYQVTGSYALDTLFGETGLGVSGLEASAVTYARDRGSLFFVGDEGTGVVEISKTGQTLSTMRFIGGSNEGWPAASTNRDAEALTYLGNGVLVVGEERLQDAFRFSYAGNTNFNQANVATGVDRSTVPFVSIGGSAGNRGLEGFSYDPRTGGFVSIKQDTPSEVRAGTLTFDVAGGVSTMAPLFNPDVLGIPGAPYTLSDIQTLSPIDALAGTAAADHLLILSLSARRLLEVSRSGQVMSFLDLAQIAPNNGIEGVTVDENGTIYLIAEQEQDGSTLNPYSRLIVMDVQPVPEPAEWAFMIAGLGFAAGLARRRAAKRA